MNSRRSFLRALLCAVALAPFAWMRKPKKARIERVGTVENGIAYDWTFNCAGCNCAGIECCADGLILYGGYTIQELAEIAHA